MLGGLPLVYASFGRFRLVLWRFAINGAPYWRADLGTLKSGLLVFTVPYLPYLTLRYLTSLLPNHCVRETQAKPTIQTLNNPKPRSNQITLQVRMPRSGSSGNSYNVTSSGSNSQVLSITLSSILTQDIDSKIQGNHYCSRDYTPSTGGSQANSNTYHYSNSDGKLVPACSPTKIRVAYCRRC